MILFLTFYFCTFISSFLYLCSIFNILILLKIYELANMIILILEKRLRDLSNSYMVIQVVLGRLKIQPPKSDSRVHVPNHHVYCNKVTLIKV